MRRSLSCLLLFLLMPCVAFARTQNYSSFSDRPDLFLKAIEEYKNNRLEGCQFHEGAIRGGIVTHHFLADQMMVDFFECLASQTKPERIILMGPDHFRKGLNAVSVSSLPWKTPFGMLDADKEAVGKIRKALDLKMDDDAFSGEHSIGILVPFIRHYFPDTRIVPLTVKKQLPKNMSITLAELLRQYQSDPKTLILLSMDFSHYQPPDESDRRDEISKRVILDQSIELINSLDVDSPSGLFLLLSAMNGSDISIRQHSNSAKITGKMGLKSVTGYFTIFFVSKPK